MVPKISLIMMDREFFSAETISYLNKNDIPYLIPCRNTSGVVKRLRDFVKYKKSVSEMEITSQSQRVPYTMAIVKREKKKRNREELETGGGIHQVCNQPTLHRCQKVCEKVGD